LKLTTDRHEVSRGLFATAELLVGLPDTDFCHLNANISKTVSGGVTCQLELNISSTGPLYKIIAWVLVPPGRPHKAKYVAFLSIVNFEAS